MAQFKEPVIEDFEADDIRAYYDSKVLRVWHLAGKDRTYKIARVQRITTEFRGETKKRPLLWLTDGKGRPVPLPLELNATNRNSIQQLYGDKVSAWLGRLITLYPTQTDMAGQTVDCIRVRNQVPGQAATRQNKQRVNVIAPPKSQAQPAPAQIANGEDSSDADDSEAEDFDEPPPGALSTDVTDDDGEETDSVIQ
jgi:hypothetical protein